MHKLPMCNQNGAQRYEQRHGMSMLKDLTRIQNAAKITVRVRGNSVSRLHSGQYRLGSPGYLHRISAEGAAGFRQWRLHRID
ncbi:MAG TPA: hypothetical protein VKB93_15620 [Thermoanaerobaculia bacterium]|nr:hypothetical protein [Thermoanaerobaculia bacterium]